MVIGGMSARETKKLREMTRKKKNRRLRTSRKTLLSDKTAKMVLDKFGKDHDPENKIKDEVAIDEHVKMNDSYMRTGWYVPKKK